MATDPQRRPCRRRLPPGARRARGSPVRAQPQTTPITPAPPHPVPGRPSSAASASLRRSPLFSRRASAAALTRNFALAAHELKSPLAAIDYLISWPTGPQDTSPRLARGRAAHEGHRLAPRRTTATFSTRACRRTRQARPKTLDARAPRRGRLRYAAHARGALLACLGGEVGSGRRRPAAPGPRQPRRQRPRSRPRGERASERPHRRGQSDPRGSRRASSVPRTSATGFGKVRPSPRPRRTQGTAGLTFRKLMQRRATPPTTSPPGGLGRLPASLRARNTHEWGRTRARCPRRRQQIAASVRLRQGNQ